MRQPTLNIGMVGHVDHGKTTLVAAMSGVWTDRHSEEIKRGISIRLGYADTEFRKCPLCPDPECYMVEKKCPVHDVETEFLRKVSFVDSPGHETLMATMLSGAAIMDGAVLVIAANEPCPQHQTKEHLMALNIVGVKNIVIVQNKIDIVDKEQLLEHYHQIKEFVKGTVAENAPIVPVSAQQKVNIDVLIKTLLDEIPEPERDMSKPARMYIARSFDVNKPGTPLEKIMGGVIGGSLSQGKFRVGQEIEIRPGIKIEAEGTTKWKPLKTTITSIMAGNESLEEATPGGLIALGTLLDPYLTKGDSLAGQIAGEIDTLPPVWDEFDMELTLLERVVGTADEFEVEPISTREPLMLNVGTATTVGVVTSARESKGKFITTIKLKRPVCAEEGARIAISRRIGSRWRLIGYGILKKK
ncbi:translation initiation factor IF-2 subunit gamma [Methanosarcinales archaeon]|nr:MAG: translation initiation factor IF-2 subunit gamma [Methanosarcinales archaeon]